ncbi:MAG: cyclase family protein [Bacillota bacterium]|nr:cyclase family protein [Bacillota bacterium]
MKIYDISMSIYHDMPVYKGKTSKKPIVKIINDYSSGSVYETKLEMNLHTGTHIDSPLHMLQGGEAINKLALEKVVTKCKVLDFSNIEHQINKEHLAQKDIAQGDFILLKTKNSFLDILEGEFVYLDKTGAEYLRNKEVIGVGIDALGIERNQPDHETHKILLGSHIIVLEGLRLKEIEEDEYLLVAPPICIDGAEASPVRALLIKIFMEDSC